MRSVMQRCAAAFLGVALLAGPWAVLADADAGMPAFPALTGPVVDGANLLPADAAQALNDKLRAYDQQSGNQLVVVTVQTLDGYPIEEWGYQLGRHWGLGDKTKNTGALLIVDKDDHRLRIEVGYGLEGTLTDAMSDDIIRNTIVPKFKQGDYPGGISDGVDGIIGVLNGGDTPAQQSQRRHDDHSNLFLMIFILFIVFRVVMAGFFARRGNGLFGLWWLLGGFGGGWGGRSGGGGWGGGGFGGGGGFSGGGGSFGGGGASGSW